MDIRVVAQILGTLAYCVSAAMMIPLAYAVYAVEGEAAGIFFCSSFVSLLLGGWLRQNGLTPDRDFTLREGIAVTTLGWLMVSVLSMQPYYFGGWLNFLDSITESISGLSGTGATVMDVLDHLPRSLLLWRSLTNWVGGLGIIVIFMALLPQFGRGAVYMMQAESTGPTKERQLPRIKDNAAALFKIYLSFTVVCGIVYVLCGMPLYDAVNHALTTIATGGFSTQGSSFIYYDNPLLEAWAVFFMVIASGSFGMYVMAWRHGGKIILRNTEFKVFLAVFAVATVLVTADLVTEMGMDIPQSLRYASFQVAALFSTTGYVSNDFDLWPSFSKSVLLFLMFVGGCGGSTAGGLKVMRLVVLIKMVKAAAWQKLHPQIVAHVRMNGNIMPPEVLYGIARHFFIYVMLDVLFAFAMILDGISMIDAVSVAVSTMGSVGPGFGIAGATSTYALLPDFSKVVACFAMFLGRLEIFTVLALLQPEFWRWHKAW
ncbi:TrkH family potassium uptake protein [Schwartzia sp. (in: firmicutes)]